jgi:hypothetical protein
VKIRKNSDIFSALANKADLEATGLENLSSAYLRIASDIFTTLASSTEYKRYPLTMNSHAAPICNNVLSAALKLNNNQVSIVRISYGRNFRTKLSFVAFYSRPNPPSKVGGPG